MKFRILFFLYATFSCALSQTWEEWKKQGDEFEMVKIPKEALLAYERALALAPKEVSILLKIAKQHGDLMTTQQGPARKKSAEQSLAFSRKALQVGPDLSDSHLAVALSLAKLTEFMGNQQKLVASREMKERAENALKLNPKSDYAHHLLGRWHQEMAAIGAGVRFLSKVVYGAIPKGSYQEALGHFEKARKLQPKRLIHQMEYGRTLAMMGERDKARIEIEKALAMPTREADDADAKTRGRQSLKDL